MNVLRPLCLRPFLGLSLLLPLLAHAQTPPPAAAPTVAPVAPEDVDQVEEVRMVQGVRIASRVYGKDAAAARTAALKTLDEMQRMLDKLDVTTRRSEIAAINASAGVEEVLVSEETYQVLSRSIDLCRRSGGAYDPTVATYDYLWNFALVPFVRPLPDEIAARRPMVGCDKIILKPQNHAVRVVTPGTRVTVAGIEHGFVLERAADYLRKLGFANFRLRVGRDEFAEGRVGTRHWLAYAPDSRHPHDPGFQLYLTGQAAVTVSDLDRAVNRNGKHYHDILDPRAGVPADHVAQVTVISTDPTMAAAMARAVFVLGPKAGLALLQKEKQGEGFLIDHTGKIWATPGMADLARLPGKVLMD